MKKVAIETDQAPPALGPYTQAVSVGPFVFVSGQIPVDLHGNLDISSIDPWAFS